MIPRNIKSEHVLKAIEEVERIGIPKGRVSKKFLLKYNANQYPPKYVISLANRYANGKELDPSEFSGGKESNNFLKYLGFNIVESQSTEKTTPKSSIKDKGIFPQKTYHGERCQRCKKTIKAMLEKIYGKVETSYKFHIGVDPEDFQNIPHYKTLKEIYDALQKYRGHTRFVRAKTIPNCDFFIPNPGFILEFDESQHFTTPRKISLERYTKNFELGFNRKRWINLCGKTNAKDNRPLYRDEQRAWYDTLRDILPTIENLSPTVRFFARDFEWCSLNPSNPSDVETFENFLKGDFGRWRIELRKEPNPFLARIIVANEREEWEGNPDEARNLLEDVCKKWPRDKKVKFLITCGGFVEAKWPEQVVIRDVKNPVKKDIENLIKSARKCCDYLLDRGLKQKLAKYSHYLTIGIDLYSDTENYSLTKPHIELVALIDLKNNRWYWTGKSYPIVRQENGLLRICDLHTHFLNLNVGKLLVLGCHDLKVFDPMSQLNPNIASWRKKVNKEFKKLVKKEKPTYVLQHPHTTDCVEGENIQTRIYTPGTWDRAWKKLKEIVPSMKEYASAGKYFNPDGKPRSQLDDVLKKTKSGNTIDFIIWKNREE